MSVLKYYIGNEDNFARMEGGAAAATTLKPFLVSSDQLTVGSRWKKWKRSFTYHVDGRGITNANRKKALLMDCAGKEVQDIFDTLTADGEGAEYKRAVRALDRYFTMRQSWELELLNGPLGGHFRLVDSMSWN